LLFNDALRNETTQLVDRMIDEYGVISEMRMAWETEVFGENLPPFPIT
jgi:hypothetical protein